MSGKTPVPSPNLTKIMTNLTKEQQDQIVYDLRAFVTQQGSQMAASKIIGISNATISKLLADKSAEIIAANRATLAPEMWAKIETYVSKKRNRGWQYVPDSVTNKIQQFVTDAAQNHLAFGLIGNAGFGKTSTAQYLSENDANIRLYVVSCDEFMSKTGFLKEILKAMGDRPESGQTQKIAMQIVEKCRKIGLHKICFLFDEIDKVSDDVFYLFISLYNRLEEIVGFVLTGTSYLQRRITDGAEKGKKGYEEIFSRLGGKFIELPSSTANDLESILHQNGIMNKLTVNRIVNEVIDGFGGDKRRLKRMAMAELRREAQS